MVTLVEGGRKELIAKKETIMSDLGGGISRKKWGGGID